MYVRMSDIAPSVKCLSYKQEDQSLIPRTQVKILDARGMYLQSLGRQRDEQPLGLLAGQPHLIGEL